MYKMPQSVLKKASKTRYTLKLQYCSVFCSMTPDAWTTHKPAVKCSCFRQKLHGLFEHETNTTHSLIAKTRGLFFRIAQG